MGIGGLSGEIAAKRVFVVVCIVSRVDEGSLGADSDAVMRFLRSLAV